MKKNILVLSIIFLVLLLSASAYTFAFFNSRISQTTIDFDTNNTAEIVFVMSQEQVMALHINDSLVDGSYEPAEQGQSVSALTVNYRSIATRVMNFSVTKIDYGQNGSAMSEQLKAYYDNLFEFNFANVTGIESQNYIVPQQDWHSLSEFSAQPTLALPLNLTEKIGSIALFVRIKSQFTSNLVPIDLAKTSISFVIRAQ